MNLYLYVVQDIGGGIVDLVPDFIGEFGDYDAVMKAACRHVAESGRGFVFRVFDEDCDPLARIEIMADRSEFTSDPIPEDELLDELYGFDGYYQ